MTTTETIEGVVSARNENGIKVLGEWRNRSKFHPLDLPEVGRLVRLGLDPKGYITSLEVLNGDDVPATPAVSSRDQTISRLAVLKAAANFLGQLSQTRDDVRSEHVLVLAEKWLAWAEQVSET